MTTVAEPSYRKRMGYQAGLLGGMALLASVAVVSTDMSTREEIALRRAEDLQASLSEVIPSTRHDNDLLADRYDLPGVTDHPADPDYFYRASMDGRPSAVAFSVAEPGYSGDISLIMGVAADGELLGVRVVSHTETPGLGDKIEAGKSDWITRFSGLSLADPAPDRWAVKKDGGEFDQFSGATITPRAVVRGIKRGLEFFQRRRGELLNEGGAIENPAETGS